VTIKHWVTIAPSLPLETKPNFPNVPTQSSSMVGPDSMISSRVLHSITPEDMSNLTANRANLYSFGIVEYTDIFDIKHWTTFCYRSLSLIDLNLVACSGWNDADRN
jgi:hypothetical protein